MHLKHFDIQSITPPEFWIFISKLMNGVGEPCCPVLSKFCLDLLALPHFSAAGKEYAVL